MKALHFAALLVASLNLAACATIVRGTDEQVSVNTDPVGAKIRFSNGQECIGPCTIKAKRNQSLQITITKPGCATQTATMVPSLGGAGVILGGLIDYGTGAVYDLQPNPLTVSLVCGATAQGPFPTVAMIAPAADATAKIVPASAPIGNSAGPQTETDPPPMARRAQAPAQKHKPCPISSPDNADAVSC